MDQLERSWRARTTEVERLSGEAAAETSRPILNELAIGRIYASIEDQCRSAREDEKRARELNLAVLTDLQRNSIQALAEARKLANHVSSARSLRLLAPSFDGFFSTEEIPVGTQASGMPGCTLPRSFVTPDSEPGNAAGYLGLRIAQVRELNLLTQSLDGAAFDILPTIYSARRLIDEAIEQPVVDPATVGRHYAAIETTCRDWRAESVKAIESAVALLDTTQRERLRNLDAAARLEAAISDAEAVGLIPGYFDFTYGEVRLILGGPGGNPMDSICSGRPHYSLLPFTTNPSAVRSAKRKWMSSPR
ncbi:MAG: hypothetical protein JNK87_02045 [Bryobacterales bacterium]|nr:hypothetical protein [Bryobacterales bacterium]